MNMQLRNARRELDNLVLWADGQLDNEHNDRQLLLEELLRRLAALSAEMVEQEQPAPPAPDVQASADGGNTFVNVRKGHGHVGMQIGVIHGNAVFGTGRPSDVDGGGW